MSVPVTTTKPLESVLTNVWITLESARTHAQGRLTESAAGAVNSDWIFRLVSQLRSLVTTIAGWQISSGLDAYANAQVPSYAGTLSTDLTAVSDAAQACIDWVVTNFPKDTTNTFVLSHVLNADGTFAPRNFSSVQTAGLRTQLQGLINTIS